ncbi:hypothetical protein [Streptomyces sp. SCSIO ZS0520]|uniref:hypothetical protein n=1 Tax=Streptomyces sp. SCSIO ZS0520 TaxID=2892996 RepID=UPI0021D80D79|nr:hypothetical protein [Streptomyces sp. SCSIO ZS0520]
MAFGRKPPPEPPVEPVDWVRVRQFSVGTVERPATAKRKRVGWGPSAVRVPKGGKDHRVLAPCAWLGDSAQHGLPSAPRLTLFADPERTRLLCYVEEGVDVAGEQHFAVRDGDGGHIGTLKRIPPKRPFRHTWRIEQPGHPEITGRNEWLSGDAKEIAGHAAGRAFSLALDAVTSFGNEGGDQPEKRRPLQWRAEDKVVMESEGSKTVTVKADWVDRRLAFAFALVGDD